MQTDTPQIENDRNNKIAAKSGNNVSIDCFVHGNPAPSVTWHYANGNQILPEGDRRIDIQEVVHGSEDINGTLIRNTLIITFVESGMDYGVYRCTATNSIGSYSHFIQLTGIGELKANKHINKETPKQTIKAYK